MDALGEPLLDPRGETKRAQAAKRKLLMGAGLCTAFMLTEIVGGIMCHSLAIIKGELSGCHQPDFFFGPSRGSARYSGCRGAV